MPEVNWQPGLLELPSTGTWVVALQGDGVLVHEGMVGYIVGIRNKNQPIIRWTDDHQCIYPLQHLQRLPLPLIRGWRIISSPETWRPAAVDNTPDGAQWDWIRRPPRESFDGALGKATDKEPAA